jgi:hypothetical protein
LKEGTSTSFQLLSSSLKKRTKGCYNLTTLGSMKTYLCGLRCQISQYFSADNNDAVEIWVLNPFNENDIVATELEV